MGLVKIWTEGEDLFLKEHYANYGPTWCGEKLERSSGGTQRRASKLGLKSNKTKIKYHKDNLINIVKESKTLSDVLNALGLRCAGGNFQTIKKYIKLYDIDTSHFYEHEEKIKQLKEYHNSVKKPMKEILVKGSTYYRKGLKKRLVEEGLLEYECSGCGNKGEWMGKVISLQLDHINGVNNDNRIENLRFLCPNCHSQTETYAGKNSSKKREKKDMFNGKGEKEVKLNTVRVDKRKIMTENKIKNHKIRRVTKRPPYEQLIKEIEELGYTGTGRKYDVSDNAIRKWKNYYEKYE